MIRTCREYLQGHIGAPVEARASAAGSTLDTASAQILRQDPRRIGFTFVNLSANEMYVTPVGAASATNGIRVGPSGGSVNVQADDDGEMSAWEWVGIATAAASNYFILEQLLVTAEGAG
jgi:hypothetical protein